MDDLLPPPVVSHIGGLAQAPITGEPFPRKVPSDEYGRELLSGCVIKQGEAYCLVDKTGLATVIGEVRGADPSTSHVDYGSLHFSCRLGCECRSESWYRLRTFATRQ
jgi:hypothetical protein